MAVWIRTAGSAGRRASAGRPLRAVWSAALFSAWAGALFGPGTAGATTAEALHAWWRPCVEAVPQTLPECAATREALALSQASDRAERRAGELWLKTGAEWAMRYTDRTADESGPGRHAYFLGPLDDLDADLVLILESGRPPRFDWLYGSGRAALPLDALPWPATDGHWLLIVADGDGPSPGSVTLVQQVGARWRQQFRYQPPAGIRYRFVGWRGDAAAVRLAWQRSGSPSCGAREGHLQLRDGPYGWDFFPAPPAGCR